MSFQAEGFQTTIALALSALLWLTFAVQEWRRSSRKRLWLRLALSLVAVASLLLIGLEPTRVSSTQKKVALLSDSLSSKLLDSLAQTGEFETLALFDDARVERIQDAGFVARNFPTSEICVFGFGLSDADLTRLCGRKVTFREIDAPTGIAELRSPQSIPLGENALVSGLVRGAFQRLVFKVDGVALDSLAKLSGETRFEFAFKPKRLGKHLLSLALDEREETFGVVVVPIEPLTILLLESEPTFETKRLKNFLAENGYRLALQIAVGKERFREEFWNLPKQTLRPLSPKTLDKFDLVAIDAKTLLSLASSERVALQRAVVEDGLGVFVTDFDSAFWREDALKFFHSFRLRAESERESELSWERVRSPTIELEAYAIEETFGVQTLMRDAKGNAVAAFAQKGLGRVGISLAKNTFRWRLEGRREAHASHWARLFSALAKPQAKTKIEVPTLAIANAPIDIVLQTAEPSPRLVARENSQTIPIPLRQDPLHSARWRGRFWARQSGWIELVANERDTAFAFVSDETSFESLRKEARRKATANFVKNNVVAQSEAEATTKRERDLPLTLWLFVAFALSMGGLWLERKL
ncbi:MAG: hypothetical protein NZM06_05750 [Chloroherpetonaceae bacterium]|nr:hypothetical protein [Chloroherpetonaceae bacterium]